MSNRYKRYTADHAGDRVRRVAAGESIPTKKGGKPNAHLQIRTTADGRKYEWHPTKGFRRWIEVVRP
jgi:hypothetical protein